MNKKTPIPRNSIPSHEMFIHIPKTGKTYAICSQAQIDSLRIIVAEDIITDAQRNGEEMTEERANELALQRIDEEGFATLNKALSYLTPAEVQEWYSKYRFAPIVCRKPKY